MVQPFLIVKVYGTISMCEERLQGGLQLMAITVNIAGQVGQIRLAQSKALWPLFETVINSVQSLEDTDTPKKQITVEALRNPNVQLRMNEKGETEEELSRFFEFVVTDNGMGFTEENYNSFLEAYSQLKVKKGCKGIGRFLWLKVFDKVKIESIFIENGKWYKRSFEFSINGIMPEDNLIELEGTDYTRETKVHLKDFAPHFRDTIALGLESLAKKTIEHCLPYFIMSECPTMVLKDSSGEEIQLNEYYKKTYKDSLHRDEFKIRGRDYSLYHMLLAEGADKHELHLCANNREVKTFDLSKHIPNMQKRLATEAGSCYYVGYLAGDYLDEAINMERSEFEFQDMAVMGERCGASEAEIVDDAVEHIRVYLHDDLSKIEVEKKRQIDRFVQSKRPMYRYLLNKRPDVYNNIPIGLTEDKLDVELFKQQQQLEIDIKQQGKDIEEKIKNNVTSEPGFDKLFEMYCQSITELSRASLAEYVAKRKAVINLLEKALEIDENGKYSKEERVHSIICPMQTTSDDIKYDDMNLWLIDERFSYHHYLASDKKMASLTVLETDADKRMDIAVFDAALSFAADPDNIRSITIVEFKKPQRDDYTKEEKNPIDQVYEYVKAIKAGKVKKANGRGFGNVKDIAFYCYIVADITPTLQNRADLANLQLTQDGDGYFGYNSAIGSYIEIISYDKLLKDAKQRNRVLFDKLFNPKASELVHPEFLGN